MPECGLKLKSTVNGSRRSRILDVPKFANGSMRKLKEQCFQVNGPMLWNALPNRIREITGCTINDFKIELDNFLMTVCDEPSMGDLKPLNIEGSNSLLHQIRSRQGCSWSLGDTGGSESGTPDSG